VWVVLLRRPGRAGLTYDQAVEEALCFGWIDSKQTKLDDRRTLLRFSPRRRGSGWARSNKARVERLLAEGRMAEAGLARVEEAKRDGSWSMLDAVEDLVVPGDLAAAFADHPGSRERWDGLPRSVRRAALAWIVQARRPDTRTRRVTETARLTARGERPGPGPRS